MKHLIDKSALVAEIKKLNPPFYPTLAEKYAYQDAIEDCVGVVCDVEVKDVDINKEISQFIDTNFEKATIGHKLSLRRVANHFFELGLKAQKGE